MDCIYLVVTEKNDLLKGEENFSSALNRYYKYVISESIKMNFRTFGCEMDTQKDEIQILFDLYQYTEKLNQFNVIRLTFSENNNNRYYDNFEVKSFYVLDLLNKDFFSEKINSLNYIPKWQIEELIENTYFRKITANFKHRATKDLVNSELGVLKVWLDNSNNNEKQSLLDNDFCNKNIDLNKVKNILTDLKKEIRQWKEKASIPQFLDTEISKKIGLIDSIENVFFPTNGEINMSKLNHLSNAKKQNISSKIFKLFSFISEYHEKIEIIK